MEESKLAPFWIFGRKKRNILDDLENLRNRLEDAKFNIRSRQRSVERQIKKYLKKGKVPPSAYLASWKIGEVLTTTIDGSIASLEGAMMLHETVGAIKEATKTKEMAKAAEALKKITASLSQIRPALDELIGLQRGLVSSTQRISERMENILGSIAEMTEEVLPEAVQDIGAEFIEKLKIESPEFFKEIPEDLKKKLGIEEKEKTG